MKEILELKFEFLGKTKNMYKYELEDDRNKIFFPNIIYVAQSCFEKKAPETITIKIER